MKVVMLLLAVMVTRAAGLQYRAKPDRTPGWQRRAGLTVTEYDKVKKKVKAIKKLYASLHGRALADWEIADNNRIGDIAVTSYQADYIHQRLLSKIKRRWKRKVVNPIGIYHKWTSPIQYAFQPDNFSGQQQATIRSAIQILSDITCLEFQEIQSGYSTTSHLEFANDGSISCWSYIGMAIDGAQMIQLGDWCSEWRGYIIHEVSHALLLDHEHQRPDRDQYIRINLDNADSNVLASLGITDLENILDDQIPFDYGSVMMYASRSGSRYGDITIETKNPLNQKTLGQPVESSFFDTKAINMVYCANICPDKMCSRNGYADPSLAPLSCTSCRCPDGFGGNTCDEPAPSSQDCSPTGGVIQVTSTTEQCLESPYYSIASTYPLGSYCSWHLKASSGATISARFIGEFGILCKDKTETCAHWVEIKNDTGLLLRGFRFCCEGTPLPVLTATGEMMVIFNAKYTKIPASAPSVQSDPWFYRGFKMCYKLNTTLPTDPCLPSPCLNGGLCYPQTVGYFCYCLGQYTGINCEATTIPPDPCLSSPCQNGGLCYLQTAGYFCYCLGQHTGIHCEVGSTTAPTPEPTIPSNPCSSSPCQNGGQCYPQTVGYFCYCFGQYTGINCEVGSTTAPTPAPTIPSNPCSSSPCQNEGLCYPQTVGFFCYCLGQYGGTHCEVP